MNKSIKYIFIVLGIAGIVMIALGLSVSSNVFSKKSNSVPIENIFVDIDGDGDIDYLESGYVIYNNGQPENLP